MPIQLTWKLNACKPPAFNSQARFTSRVISERFSQCHAERTWQHSNVGFDAQIAPYVSRDARAAHHYPRCNLRLSDEFSRSILSSQHGVWVQILTFLTSFRKFKALSAQITPLILSESLCQKVYTRWHKPISFEDFH